MQPYAEYKTLRKNLEWRYKTKNKAKTDLKYRAVVKELFHRDVLYAFNCFFFTLDVRKRPFHNQPFCTYPYQDEYIVNLVESILSGKDHLSEKSRDMGVSWMVISVFVWLWLNPNGGSDFLLGSRIEDYVDKKGDMRTLLEKARYIINRLPNWLKPEGYNAKLHDNFMRLVNPETGSSITGESNNANWSTGGRYLAGLLDEFAKWESTDQPAWTSAGDATPCRIAVSTPFGAGGQYYKLATEGQINKKTLHWSLHPEKAKGLYCVWPKPEEAHEVVDSDNWVGLRSTWYDIQCKRRRPNEIAQELDIDYIGAGNPVFDGTTSRRIIQLSRLPKTPVGFLKVAFGKEYKSVEAPEDWEDHIVIYEEPDEKKSYVVAVDVATGVEDGDFSIIKVLCRETDSLVASYYSMTNEIELAGVLAASCLYYTNGTNYPWWAVEVNGPGIGTFDTAVDVYQLPNAFMMPSYDIAKQSASFRKGWWTGTTSRRELVAGIKTWLLHGEGWVDGRCCTELSTFVVGRDKKPQAKTGCHDDEVMAFGIALQVNQIAPYESYTEPERLRDDGLPETLFQPEKAESLSTHEHCMTQTLDKQTEKEEMYDYF